MIYMYILFVTLAYHYEAGPMFIQMINHKNIMSIEVRHKQFTLEVIFENAIIGGYFSLLVK